MELIPAIDLIGGACVRLSQGDYLSKKEYSDNPLEMAKRFEASGLTRLHLVDLEGAKGGESVNLKTLENIAKNTSLVIDFGGGIKKIESLRRAFDAGASMVTCGSIAAKDPELVFQWLEVFKKDRLILGADAKDGKIATTGWTESSGWELGPFIDMFLSKGFERVICTDIACDGMLGGPSLALYKTLLEKRKSLRLIASGGISSIEDLQNLQAAGLDGAIIGKALYEGNISLAQLSAFREESDAC